MPGPAIGIGSRIGGLGQSTVGQATVADWCRLIDRRPDQRVAENDPRPNGQQPVGLGRGDRVGADAKVPGGAPQQGRVAERLGGGHQRDALGHLRQPRDAPHETLLVMDATTGQNGLQQARQFTQSSGVTGIVLTKLDGTAKGGVVVAISRELGLPVRYVGVGEKVGDLLPFDPKEFVESLFT